MKIRLFSFIYTVHNNKPIKFAIGKNTHTQISAWTENITDGNFIQIQNC